MLNHLPKTNKVIQRQRLTTELQVPDYDRNIKIVAV